MRSWSSSSLRACPPGRGGAGIRPLGDRDHSLYELCRTFVVRCASCQASAAASPRLWLRLRRCERPDLRGPSKTAAPAHGRAAARVRRGRPPWPPFPARRGPRGARRPAVEGCGDRTRSARSTVCRPGGGDPATCRCGADRSGAAGPRLQDRSSSASRHGSCRPTDSPPARSRPGPPPRRGAGGSARPWRTARGITRTRPVSTSATSAASTIARDRPRGRRSRRGRGRGTRRIRHDRLPFGAEHVRLPRDGPTPGAAGESPPGRRLGCGRGRAPTAPVGRDRRGGRPRRRRGPGLGGPGRRRPGCVACPELAAVRQHVVVGDVPGAGRPCSRSWGRRPARPRTRPDGRSSAGPARCSTSCSPRPGLARGGRRPEHRQVPAAGQPDAEGARGGPVQRLAAPPDRAARPAGRRGAGPVGGQVVPRAAHRAGSGPRDRAARLSTGGRSGSPTTRRRRSGSGRTAPRGRRCWPTCARSPPLAGARP